MAESKIKLLFVWLVLLVPLYTSCSQPTDRELAAAKIQQVINNPAMPDTQAAQLLAEAQFGFESWNCLATANQ